jgi:hypothetical protein
MTNPYNLIGWNSLLINRLSEKIEKALENKETKVKMNNFTFNLAAAIAFRANWSSYINQNPSLQEEYK